MEANAFLEALYNANYERLYIYAENLLFNAAYAEEAVQETFFEAVRKQDALMRHAKPEAWLMETLKNKIRVGSRRRALEALYFISLEQDLAQERKKLAVEDRPFGSINELLDAIRALLPPEDYRLLCRITLEGATHLEVAKELGISVWSSQKRLQRIRKKLCKQLLPNKSKKISKNMSVWERRLLTTGNPIVILGTNSPSMTSTCSQSAPAARTSSTSPARLQKSADSIDGAILTMRYLRNGVQAVRVIYSGGKAREPKPLI